MQNVLVEHEMFDKFGGGETSKQGQTVETISCQVNNVEQFRQALIVKKILPVALDDINGSWPTFYILLSWPLWFEFSFQKP